MKCSNGAQFSDEELVQLSGLQHLAYCERQWALIHLEDRWTENRFTVEGNIMHERSDEADTEVRNDVRIARGLRLRSLRLGLVGKADVVEFHRIEDRSDEGSTIKGIRLEGASGLWRPFPVEYKRGRPKSGSCDEIQLCAQALCLEEMLDAPVRQGALFYGQPRRRRQVELDDSLRQETERLSHRLHELMEEGRTPPPPKDRQRCRNCSLRSACLPDAAAGGSARRYLRDQLRAAKEESSETSP